MKRLLWEILGWPLGLSLWAWTVLVLATARLRVEEPTAGQPTIYVNWHRHLPLVVPLHGRSRRWMMMSASPYMAPIARWSRLCGLQLVRGASGAGGRAALGLLAQKLAAGASVVLAVDGPSGPPFVVKPGCADLALATGRPIIALAYRGRPSLQTPGRWDHQLLLWPFARVELLASAPIVAQPGETREALVARVQAVMLGLEARAG